jgi:hypothetical protein
MSSSESSATTIFNARARSPASVYATEPKAMVCFCQEPDWFQGLESLEA